MTQDDRKHQIWLKCMQMPNCSQEEASNFIKTALPLLNTTITPTGQTLLMIASSVGSYFIVRECLLQGSNIGIKDSAGRIALHYAASVGNIQIFQQLVHRGSNPREQTIGGETPLAKSCVFCQGDIIEWYLNNDLSAFQVADKYDKKPLDMLKLSGEGLYEEVIEVYAELTKEQMENEG